ncbi:MAG: hypothetical protein ACOZIN_21645, partial [Myxococcota bacterium]
MRAKVVALLALGLWACGSEDTRCVRECPDVSGTFGLRSSIPFGRCPFPAFLLGPSLVLEQTEGNVRTMVVDPVSQLPFVLAGDVFNPSDGEMVGAVRLRGEVVRPSTRPSDELVRLQLHLGARLYVEEERLVVSGALDTWSTGSVGGAPSCRV